jgi:cytochrome c oxidase subunit IV
MATDTDHDTDHQHPGVGQYVEIGVILAVLTALEVALFYADIIPAVTIPALITLTIMKFMLVIFWFMHLRFDHRLFRRLFYAGLFLAAAVWTVVIVITVFGSRGNV